MTTAPMDELLLAFALGVLVGAFTILAWADAISRRR